MKVFGEDKFDKKGLQELQSKSKDKKDPSKWNWKPAKPDKIVNITDILKREKEETNFSCITNYQISDTKQEIVFLFAMGNLSYGLIENLKINNVKFVYVNFNQFVAKGIVDWSISNTVQRRILKIEDVVIDLNDIKVVFWNPPFYPHSLFENEFIPVKRGRHRFLHRKRWSQVIKEFRGFLNENVLWIPGDPYTGSQDWQNKLTDYRISHEEGIKVPPFILTNDINELEKFCKENGEELLYREFSTPPFSFPPVKINLESIDSVLLKTSPCVFQKNISKVYEYRVVMFMDKIYPCKIYSQDSELTKDDWRIHDDANVKWEISELPIEVSNKLFKIKNRLGLTWCSIDIIFSTDENYYFLEANRPGAHYWLDMFVGLDISKEIVETLLKNQII